MRNSMLTKRTVIIHFTIITAKEFEELVCGKSFLMAFLKQDNFRITQKMSSIKMMFPNFAFVK